jgi:hypothetical protein
MMKRQGTAMATRTIVMAIGGKCLKASDATTAALRNKHAHYATNRHITQETRTRGVEPGEGQTTVRERWGKALRLTKRAHVGDSKWSTHRQECSHYMTGGQGSSWWATPAPIGSTTKPIVIG